MKTYRLKTVKELLASGWVQSSHFPSFLDNPNDVGFDLKMYEESPSQETIRAFMEADTTSPLYIRSWAFTKGMFVEVQEGQLLAPPAANKNLLESLKSLQEHADRLNEAIRDIRQLMGAEK